MSPEFPTRKRIDMEVISTPFAARLIPPVASRVYSILFYILVLLIVITTILVFVILFFCPQSMILFGLLVPMGLAILLAYSERLFCKAYNMLSQEKIEIRENQWESLKLCGTDLIIKNSFVSSQYVLSLYKFVRVKLESVENRNVLLFSKKGGFLTKLHSKKILDVSRFKREEIIKLVECINNNLM